MTLSFMENCEREKQASGGGGRPLEGLKRWKRGETEELVACWRKKEGS